MSGQNDYRQWIESEPYRVRREAECEANLDEAEEATRLETSAGGDSLSTESPNEPQEIVRGGE